MLRKLIYYKDGIETPLIDFAESLTPEDYVKIKNPLLAQAQLLEMQSQQLAQLQMENAMLKASITDAQLEQQN